MAKLRHEAAISEIKTSARNSVSEIVRSISDRLDKMERSAAASLTPPILPAAARARMGPAGDDGGLDRVCRVYTTVYGRVRVYSGPLFRARGAVSAPATPGRRGYRE